MGSTGKKKTTMSKLARESRLRERRLEKQVRKLARKDAATDNRTESDPEPTANDIPVAAAPDET